MGIWVPSRKGREQVARTAAGVIVEQFSPLAATSATAPTTQTVYGMLHGLLAGDVITGVLMRNAVAAAGTLPTTVRFGLADSTGKILVLSGNDNALAKWGLGANPHAFTAPYTIPVDGAYFTCFVVNGTWGTTQPTPILSSNGGAAAMTAFGAKTPPTFQLTGQTDLPAVDSSVVITTGNNRAYYLAPY